MTMVFDTYNDASWIYKNAISQPVNYWNSPQTLSKTSNTKYLGYNQATANTLTV